MQKLNDLMHRIATHPVFIVGGAVVLALLGIWKG
jgi:hypothetical protein